MKNKMLALSAVMEAVQWLFNNSDEFKACFEKEFEKYVDSLPEKKKQQIAVALKSFPK